MSSKNIFDYKPRFQFDQPLTSDALARTACTDTACQMIIEYYKDRLVSLSAIRAASGIGVDGVHGLTMAGALRALNHFGVTWYRQAVGIDATYILQKAYVGPVLAGVAYFKYPSRSNAACGQNNIAQSGGRTDCGFGGAHAVLVLGNQAIKNSAGKIVRYDAFARDPDHHSTGPDHDRMTGAQLHNAVAALKGTDGWTNTFCLYSTKKK